VTAEPDGGVAQIQQLFFIITAKELLELEAVID
jgi:hypothetical protein